MEDTATNLESERKEHIVHLSRSYHNLLTSIRIRQGRSCYMNPLFIFYLLSDAYDIVFSFCPFWV